MASQRRSFKRRGFTLVELMIVVAIIGVLAALAIFGVKSYVMAARTAEAKESVGAISRVAVLIYQREILDAEMVAEGTVSAQIANVLCGSAIPVPPAPPPGVKYQPDTADGTDFQTGDERNGWQCLNHYKMPHALHYQYHYTSPSGGFQATVLSVPNAPTPTNGPESFEAAAVGDLDNDGTFSYFGRIGEARNREITLTTSILTFNELE